MTNNAVYDKVTENGLTIAVDRSNLQARLKELMNYHMACAKEYIHDTLENDLADARKKGAISISDAQIDTVCKGNDLKNRTPFSPAVDAVVTASLDKISKKCPTDADVQSVFDDFQHIIDNIMNKEYNIFPCIPLTKQGAFSKNKTFLVKNSKVKNVCVTYEYTSQDILQLRLLPVPSRSWDAVSGDGKTLYLEVDTFSRNTSKEEAIMDENNSLHPITCLKKTYLKQSDLIVGHKYMDVKDTTYVYLGTEPHPHNPNITHYLYCRCTKKALKVLPTCNSVDDIRKNLPCKCVYNPIKFIKEVQ